MYYNFKMLICYISCVKTAEPYRYTVCLKHDGSDGTHETSCFPGVFICQHGSVQLPKRRRKTGHLLFVHTAFR